MNFSAIFKFINICLMVFFFKKMKEDMATEKETTEKETTEKETTEKETTEKEEEEKDINTWYTINNGTSRYKGEWKNGVPHGKGIKETFEGEYKDADGNPCDSHGVPRCWTTIEGIFVNGCTNGYFKQFYKQEEEETQPYYEGELYNGKHHGQGAYYYGNGSYYKGNFKESKFQGVGYHYYFKESRTWVGEFDNDKKTKGVWIDGELCNK